MKKRSNSKPQIKMPFWQRDGKLWYAEEADLRDAIQSSGVSELELKRKLGAGYDELLAALEGKRLGSWTVAHIEWGLLPESTSKKIPSSRGT